MIWDGHHKYHADYVGSCATFLITLAWLSVTVRIGSSAWRLEKTNRDDSDFCFLEMLQCMGRSDEGTARNVCGAKLGGCIPFMQKLLQRALVPCVLYMANPNIFLALGPHKLFLLPTRHSQEYHHFVAVPAFHHAVPTSPESSQLPASHEELLRNFLMSL